MTGVTLHGVVSLNGGHGGFDPYRFFLTSLQSYVKTDLKTISQGDFGHFRDNNQIILSKVAKIGLKIFLN